jgi:hypothetical protein
MLTTKRSERDVVEKEEELDDYPTGTKRTTIDVEESNIIKEFFMENTTQKSGDNTELRRMTLSYHEFMAKFHGEQPSTARRVP